MFSSLLAIPGLRLEFTLPFGSVGPAKIVPVIAGFLLLAYLLHRATSGLVKPVEGFLQALTQKDFPRARMYFVSSLSSEDERGLERFLRSSPFSQYHKARWSSRTIRNNQGRLEGTIILLNGAKIPMQVNLSRENGEWKILSLEEPESGLNLSIGANF